jgi:hypothetical protein
MILPVEQTGSEEFMTDTRRIILAAGTALLLLLVGCRQADIEELTRQELFSLGLGKMEDQIDLFQTEGELFNLKNRICMRDGLFYIANGNSAKVMAFSSYGDLIYMLYNPARNPQPVSFSMDQNLAATRRAQAFPLQQIGELTVDREKMIYVEDVVAEERRVQDKELGVILDRVILRFDRAGTRQDFIGQEGIGGTPFPYIDSLYVTENNELVVICRVPDMWQVYWYSGEGILLYHVEIGPEHLPSPDTRMIPYVAKIVPDLSGPLLYLMLYYTQDSGDDATNLTEVVENPPSRLYTLSLDSGRFLDPIEIPENGYRKQHTGSQEVEVPAPSYEFLGVSKSGHFFLLRGESPNLYQLLILDSLGKIAGRRYLVMEDSELYFREIRLSSAGILYGLLCEEYDAKIVWWRSDKLLHSDRG